ncbi:hypothetical protein HanRHA438_Chr15g0719781 [Helianthus annuus]|nr:hypothetical protein HanHA300_Chr15g0576851 [Helianthus annuus]KAJ0653508.1 hypothetical protein HanOQP8_Chr15g0584341 [Helianthus annuus]KAJ0845983.1 hypothetical protein HanRHA438_Chr15g0719781 [Helianthus annuus]
MQVHAGMLDVFFNQYEECVKRINDTLAEGFMLFPNSERIKQKQMQWDDILMKNVRASRTRCEPQTPVVLSPAKSKSVGGVSTTDLPQWTPTMVVAAYEHMESVERDNAPKGQCVKIFQSEPLDITPLSQKTATEYEFAIKRDQVTRQLDMGKRMARPQRNVELPEALRSPYVKRVVDLRSRLDAAEESTSAYMFSAWGSMWDVVFRTEKGVSVMRSPLKSLFPGICIHVSSISAWSVVLNYEERFKQRGSLSRLFCSVNMLVSMYILALFIFSDMCFPV